MTGVRLVKARRNEAVGAGGATRADGPRDGEGNPRRDPDALQGPREGPGQRRVAIYEAIRRLPKIELMLLTEQPGEWRNGAVGQ